MDDNLHDQKAEVFRRVGFSSLLHRDESGAFAEEELEFEVKYCVEPLGWNGPVDDRMTAAVRSAIIDPTSSREELCRLLLDSFATSW